MADGVAAWFNGADSPVVDYDASDLRLLDAVGLTSGGTLTARAGIRPGGFAVSVGGSPEAVTVQPGVGVVNTSSNADGSWRFALPASVSVDLTARPGVGTSRIDLVVARVYDKDVAALATALREVDVQVVTGVASASPTAPTKPNGSVLLAQLTVPNSGSVTIGGAVPRTGGAGGVLPVATSTERDALVLYAGLVVWREDTGAMEVYNGTAWASVVAPEDSWHAIVPSGAYTASSPAPQYRKDSAGNVHMRGRVARNGSASGTIFMTLPAGYRPTQITYPPGVVMVPTVSANAGRMTIDTDGAITFVLIGGTPTEFEIECVFSTL